MPSLHLLTRCFTGNQYPANLASFVPRDNIKKVQEY